MDHHNTAKRVVFEYAKTKFDKSDPPPEFTIDDVFIVWFAKTLQNWKACLSTTLPDKMYYELTYNGDPDSLYIDAYVKIDNREIKSFSSLALVAEAP